MLNGNKYYFPLLLILLTKYMVIIIINQKIRLIVKYQISQDKKLNSYNLKNDIYRYFEK